MKTIPKSSLAKLLNLIKTNYFRKSESQEVSAISIDVTPTDSSTNLVTSGGVKTELDKLGQAQTDIYSRIEDVEELISGLELAGSGSWTKQQVALLETIFANIAYIDETTGQTAANSLIASLRNNSKILSSISVIYTGGTVAAGTTLDQLTGITVTATYSDGTTETVTDYTLSGDLIAGQTNTVTVTYQGKTTTFDVTVEEPDIAISVSNGSITTNATNLTVSDGKIILS